MTSSILLLSASHWDYKWSHDKQLFFSLCKDFLVTYAELPNYKQLGDPYPIPENGSVLLRNPTIKNKASVVFLTEIKNAQAIWNSSAKLVITYLTAGAILAAITTKVRRKKLLLVYADDLPEIHRSMGWMAYALTRYVANPIVSLLSDQIVVTARLLEKDIQYASTPIEYISNGVDIDKFILEGTSDHPYTIGFVGSFGPWVNFEYLLTAAKKLPDVRFLLVGGGEQFAHVKNKAKTLPNVELTGMVSLENVRKYLTRIDVCTIPFHVNKLTDRVSPIKLFEYWAMKKPVISTSFYEIRKTGKSIICFADSKRAFIEHINDLRDGAKRSKLGMLGFEEVKKYNWSALGKKYYQLIKRLLL